MANNDRTDKLINFIEMTMTPPIVREILRDTVGVRARILKTYADDVQRYLYGLSKDKIESWELVVRTRGDDEQMDKILDKLEELALLIKPYKWYVGYPLPEKKEPTP